MKEEQSNVCFRGKFRGGGGLKYIKVVTFFFKQASKQVSAPIVEYKMTGAEQVSKPINKQKNNSNISHPFSVCTIFQ